MPCEDNHETRPATEEELTGLEIPDESLGIVHICYECNSKGHKFLVKTEKMLEIEKGLIEEVNAERQEIERIASGQTENEEELTTF